MSEVREFKPRGVQQEHFHQRLRSIRSARGYTQAELASRAGLNVSSIAHFETGQRLPSLENLCNLVHALSCTADFLLGFSDGRCEDAYRRGAFDAVEAMKAATKSLRLGVLALNGETGTENSLSANAQDEVAHRPE